MIAIVDYGLGNLGSITRGLRRAGADVVLTGDPNALRVADALVLPGDGAFGAAIGAIRERGLEQVLLGFAASGRPLLGICIGMQLLFEHGEEHGPHRGLGLLPGRVRRFETALPVPHMGWNNLLWERSHPLLAGLRPGQHVYFIHSYHCDTPDEFVIARTDYGGPFTAVAGRGSILGVQFHPEKSQDVGLTMLSNFVALTAASSSREEAAS